MGQVLHGCARTTAVVRRAIQHSQKSLNELAEQYAINPKTVAKWKKRAYMHDAPTGPKDVRSTALTAEEATAIVAFRRCTPLPLDDCLIGTASSAYALQPCIPHLTRLPCIAACNAMASAGCGKSRGIKRRDRSSPPIRLATSISTLPKCKRKKASCICLWLWIASQSSPMLSFIPMPRE